RHAPPRRHRPLIQRCVKIRTGQRDAGIGCKAQDARAESEFQPGGVAGIAYQSIRDAQGRAVQRAGLTDTHMSKAMPPEVLYRVEATGAQDFDHSNPSSATKRTRSPACSKLGGFAAGSNKCRSVWPINCQPPGDVAG